MTNVTCVLHEAVVLREHGVCLQLVGLDQQQAHLAVATLPASNAPDGPSPALGGYKQRLKGRMHAAAEALHALHVQLEQQPGADAEPLILQVYRQLRDADRELEGLNGMPGSWGPVTYCSSD